MPLSSTTTTADFLAGRPSSRYIDYERERNTRLMTHTAVIGRAIQAIRRHGYR